VAAAWDAASLMAAATVGRAPRAEPPSPRSAA